ncbi:MAG TPA: tail fiber assembly protein [Buttiauxella sp.]|jgi:hypothetical protein
MIISNFTLSKIEQNEGYAIGYLTSEDGKDWYDVQNLFDKDKLKIEYGEDGLINRMSMDVSQLWPLGKSVADVELNKVPKGINEKGMWYFDGVQITSAYIDYVHLATIKRKELINTASIVIATYQDAIELGIDGPDDLHRLDEWKKYRVQLSQMDTSLSPDIKWPVKPSE